MSEREGLLDTSVVIDLDRIESESALPLEPLVSAVTLAELAAGPAAARNDLERARRQARLQFVEATFEPLPFTAEDARSFGVVASALRGAGRKPAARAFDALLAAVALTHDLPLYTRNARDFEGIPGLEVRAVDVAG